MICCLRRALLIEIAVLYIPVSEGPLEENITEMAEITPLDEDEITVLHDDSIC